MTSIGDPPTVSVSVSVAEDTKSNSCRWTS
jgi:hypothetical protein